MIVIGREKFVKTTYSDLCNYSHFLANMSEHIVNYQDFKYRTIQVAIYVTTMYQDILIAIASFFNSPFDLFIDELQEHREKGKRILASIQLEVNAKERVER